MVVHTVQVVTKKLHIYAPRLSLLVTSNITINHDHLQLPKHLHFSPGQKENKEKYVFIQRSLYIPPHGAYGSIADNFDILQVWLKEHITDGIGFMSHVTYDKALT